MAGGGQGGNPNLALKAKHAPTYLPPSAPDTIKSERDADFTGAGPGSSTGIKLGIRVKQRSATDFQIPTLTLTTRATPGHPGTPIPLTGPLPDTDPIVKDLQDGLGCDSNEKWFAYTLNWNVALGKKFDSTLTLTPFPFPPLVTDNGFEIVTVAFCHASQKFKDGVYSYAVSVLPGKNSSGFAMSVPQASSGKKSTKKSSKKPKAKTKNKKKSRR
jgi:hypothetical protein